MASRTARDVIPGSQPRAVYFRRPDGSFSFTIARPASSSRVAHYQFSPDRSWCVRRVLSPDGTEVLFKEVVHLDERPRCSRGITDHTAIARDKLEALQCTTERLLPPEALSDLERDLRSQPEEVNEREYDGGYLPGGIGWFDEDGLPTERNDDVAWHDDVPQGESQPASHLARFFDGLAGQDAGGNAKVFAPIVEGVLFRTITHPPRPYRRLGRSIPRRHGDGTSGGRRLRTSVKETPDRYAARLERRVTLAVRHRLIDAVRRQDAATRNFPCTSLEAGQEAGMDVPASDTDPFDLLFRPPEAREHRARFRAVALAVYRDARGLARQIIRRAYLGAMMSRSTRGTLELQHRVDYSAAAQWLAEAWGQAVALMMQGAILPVYHRRRRKLTASVG
jgi:hypothetical protein